MTMLQDASPAQPLASVATKSTSNIPGASQIISATLSLDNSMDAPGDDQSNAAMGKAAFTCTAA